MTFACLVKTDTDMASINGEALIQKLAAELFKLFGSVPAMLHLPSEVEDRYTNDGVSQHSVLEIHSKDLDLIEDNIHELQELLVSTGACSNPSFQVTHSRNFLPLDREGSSQKRLTSYFVEYSGETEDNLAWCNHYIKSHVQLMKKLPKINNILVFTPMIWLYPESLTRFDSLLCNRVSFPVPDDMRTALQSPVRDEMRADYESFPVFTGKCTHYAMDTYILNLSP